MKQMLLVCLFMASAAFGQCFDDDLRGSYGFLANTGATTATTQVAGTFSTTPIGALIGSMNNLNGGTAAGSLYFDGAGRIYGSSATSLPQGVTRDVVGTYAVSSDCSVRVTIYDAFNDALILNSPNNPSLIGTVLRSGDEIYLARLATSTILSPRTAVRLVRYTDRYTSGGCNVSMLRGAFGFMGQGVFKGAFASFVARLNFDADGRLLSGSNILQYPGTYTVNPDCSGTMTITTDALTTTVRFLITPEMAYVDPAGRLVSQPAQDLKPGILFTISDADRLITGTGTAQ